MTSTRTSPTGVCIATKTVQCALIVRPTPAGAKNITWPKLVARCPWADHWAPHYHLHTISEPAPWLRLATCNWRPYMLTIAT